MTTRGTVSAEETRVPREPARVADWPSEQVVGWAREEAEGWAREEAEGWVREEADWLLTKVAGRLEEEGSALMQESEEGCAPDQVAGWLSEEGCAPD